MPVARKETEFERENLGGIANLQSVSLRGCWGRRQKDAGPDG